MIKVLEPSIKYEEGKAIDALQFKIMNARGFRTEIGPGTTISGDCSNILVDWDANVYNLKSTCDEYGGIWEPAYAGGTCYEAKALDLDPGKTVIPKTYCRNLRHGEQFEVYITFYHSERIGKEIVEGKDSGMITGYVEKKE